MRTVQSLIRRHPVPAYYLLTFLISWGGILLIIGAFGGLPATKARFDAQFPMAILAMFMHASLTVSSLTLGPLDIAGGRLLFLDLTSAVVWWAVAAVVMANGGGRSGSGRTEPKGRAIPLNRAAPGHVQGNVREVA